MKQDWGSATISVLLVLEVGAEIGWLPEACYSNISLWTSRIKVIWELQKHVTESEYLETEPRNLHFNKLSR